MRTLREVIERWLSRMAIRVNAGDAFYGYDESQWQCQQVLVVKTITSAGKVLANKFVLVPYISPTVSGIPWHKKGLVEFNIHDLKYKIFKGTLRKLSQEQIPKSYKLPNTTTQYDMEN